VTLRLWGKVFEPDNVVNQVQLGSVLEREDAKASMLRTVIVGDQSNGLSLRQRREWLADMKHERDPGGISCQR
jgi:hypothetical protein